MIRTTPSRIALLHVIAHIRVIGGTHGDGVADDRSAGYCAVYFDH